MRTTLEWDGHTNLDGYEKYVIVLKENIEEKTSRKTLVVIVDDCGQWENGSETARSNIVKKNKWNTRNTFVNCRVPLNHSWRLLWKVCGSQEGNFLKHLFHAVK